MNKASTNHFETEGGRERALNKREKKKQNCQEGRIMRSMSKDDVGWRETEGKKFRLGVFHEQAGQD